MYVGWNASGSFYWVLNHTEYEVYLLTSSQQPLHPCGKGTRPIQEIPLQKKMGCPKLWAVIHTTTAMLERWIQKWQCYSFEISLQILCAAKEDFCLWCTKYFHFNCELNFTWKTRACRHQKSLVQHKHKLLSVLHVGGGWVNDHQYKCQSSWLSRKKLLMIEWMWCT